MPGLGVQLGWWRDVNPHTLEVGEGYHWLFVYSQVEASLNYRIPYIERRKDWERKKGKGDGNWFLEFFRHCQNHLLYLPQQQQQNHIFTVLSKSRPSFTLLPITRNFYLIKESPTYIFPGRITFLEENETLIASVLPVPGTEHMLPSKLKPQMWPITSKRNVYLLMLSLIKG